MLRQITLLLPLFLCTCGPATSDTSGGPGDPSVLPPPNIVFILADDLGYGDLGVYGQQHFATPHLDRLATQGMRFTQHYSGSTVCAPSRSSLLTGLHTGHTFIRGNKEVQPEGQYPLADSVYTLGELLQDRGYRTGVFGKWGLGYPGSEGEPLAQGFDRFYGYNCQRLAHNYYPDHLWSDRQSQDLPANDDRGRGAFAPDLIHQQALAFLDSAGTQPFFMYYAHVMPHAELAAADSIVTRFAEQYGPEAAYEGYDYGPEYRLGPYGSVERPHATFAAMITTLDRHVGDIMRRLDSLGLADNTLLVFTSDNGPHVEGGADPDFFDSNGPLRGYKRDLYEGGVRVPTIARLPATIAAGSTTDHVSAFWDWYPTFAELTGEAVEQEMDGVSILPTLRGADQPDHELYWEFHERGGRQAARMGKWKGVRYGVVADPDSPLELYDLTADLGETTDVAAEHPEVVARLDSFITANHTESDAFPFQAR